MLHFPCWVRTLLSLALIAIAPQAARAAEVKWLSDVDAAWKQAREQDRPMLVLLSTSNCRYCVMLQNVSFADPDVVQIVENGFVPVAVDAKDVDWLVQEQKVVSYPTTLVISPTADIVDRIKGYLKPEELKPRLAKSAGPTRTVSKERENKK